MVALGVGPAAALEMILLAAKGRAWRMVLGVVPASASAKALLVAKATVWQRA